MTSQKFGGLWSLLKLKILGDYLTAYCTALSGKFHILYIDAFAGSGEFSIREFSAAPLFDEEESIRVVEGSARLALDCTPSFDHLYFIEMKRRNVQALEALASEYTSQKIDVLRGDANEKVIDICKGTNWKNTRGVIFLDPYGNSVEWETLARISQTKALDVWYLFPLFGVYRQAPNSLSKMTDDKRQSITKILGTDEWENHFYEPIFDQNDLFGESNDNNRRTANTHGILSYVEKRLETLFPYVAPPKVLLGPNNAPLYALFLTVSNNSEKAKALAKRISRNL